MVYIENRKAASSTIRTILARFFDADFSKCGASAAPSSCYEFGGQRCTSKCLSSQHRDYYFFTFVRNPLDRFYSALKEGLVMEEKASTTEGEAMNVLKVLSSPECGFDHHLESQSMSLSTPLPTATKGRESPHGRVEVPLDFIGRVEDLAQHMAEVLQGAQAKSGISLPSGMADEIVSFARETKENVGGNLKDVVDAVRSDELDAAVREVYAQDFACFSD